MHVRAHAHICSTATAAVNSGRLVALLFGSRVGGDVECAVIGHGATARSARACQTLVTVAKKAHVNNS